MLKLSNVLTAVGQIGMTFCLHIHVFHQMNDTATDTAITRPKCHQVWLVQLYLSLSSIVLGQNHSHVKRELSAWRKIFIVQIFYYSPFTRDIFVQVWWKHICHSCFLPPQENELQSSLLSTGRGTVCCQCVFSSSAIIASHSCGPYHADCLAFSFLGGSVEALTRFVSLSLACSLSLPLSVLTALTSSDRPPRTSAPERQPLPAPSPPPSF